MKASDALAEYLCAHGITVCYEMIGGMVAHILDSLGQHGGFRITSVHHEQAAAFAAEGLARKSSGKLVGLAIATSGPGATNLITGIGSCWFDSVPCLFLTGQVNVSELKVDRPIRQQGFQELDIVSVVRPITKYAARVMTAEDLLPQLHKALTFAVNGRQGPVLLDIPFNIQREYLPTEMIREWAHKPIRVSRTQPVGHERLTILKDLCSQARRPLFIIGGGAKWSSATDTLLADLNTAQVPYVSTLMGQERLTWAKSYCGMVGTYGHRAANYAVQQCDLLIVLGARLDVRQTGSDVHDFARHAKIVQVDIDQGQLDNRIRTALSINVSTKQFLQQVKIERQLFPMQDVSWAPTLRSFVEKTFIDEYPEWEISPFRIFKELAQALSGKEVDFVCDVGNHQMWAANCLRLDDQQTMHHSGGMGAMGFALPTAIGISAISKGKTVVLTGDGSFQVNIQELDTIARLGEDILIIVFNNRCLGMVKNFQDMYFDGRNQSTKVGYSSPSFARVAETFGIESYLIPSEDTFCEVLREIKNFKRPVLLEILMEQATECRPRLLFGCTLDKQHPPMADLS